MFCRRNLNWANIQFFLYQKLAVVVSVFLLLVFSQSVQSSEAVLEDIRITAKGKDTIIDIDLGIELIYSKHFPHSSGEILQVQMILDSDLHGDRTIHKEIRQGEDLKPPPGQEPLLIYVTYEEGVPGGPYLTLRFARRVKFEVNAGDSARGLSILVHGEELKQEIAKLDKKAAEEETAAKKKPAKLKRKKETDVGQLMAKARQALTFGDNTGAITLLRRIIALPENEHTQDARELLGLGLERDRQIPRAKFEYKKYLRLYKEGDGPKRVKQRLTALQNIGIQKRERLRVPTSRKRKKEDSFKVFGRLSQAYDYRLIQNFDTPDPDDEPVDTSLKTLSERLDTNINVRGRYRNAQRAIQIVAAGNYFFDIAAYKANKELTDEKIANGEVERDEGEGRVSDFFVDYNEIKPGFTATVGRQRARNTGLLPRFDGAMLGYQVAASMKPYIYFGSPAFFNDVPYKKKFVGAKMDYGVRKSPFGGTGYFTIQEVDGLADRQGIGGSMHYTIQSISLFGAVDYDVLFDEFTFYNFRWGWKYSKKSKMNLTYNFRKFLVKSAALNSQPQNTTIEYMETCLGEEKTLEVAKDKTSESFNITLGNSYQFNRDLNFSVDASYFKTADFAGSGDKTDDLVGCGLSSYVSSEGSELSYLLMQLVSSNTFSQNDLYVLGLNLSTSDDADQYGLYVNGRLPPYKKFNIRPRLNLDFREFNDQKDENGNIKANTGGSRTSITPSVRIDYRLMRKWIIESEFGWEFIRYHDRDNATDEDRGVVRIGYHYTF